MLRIALGVLAVLLLATLAFYASQTAVDTGVCPKDHPKCGVP